MDNLGLTPRLSFLAATLVLALVAVSLVDPIAQDPGYHAFADTRLCFGLPNFGDAASNIGFAVIGLWGLGTVWSRRGRALFADRADALPYLVFFAGVTLVSAGSAYYHTAPDNDRLFWDRLPMTIAFMALFAAFLADRIHAGITIRWGLPVLIAAGVLSLLYWDWTEAQGHGDLRFYALIQFYPLVALPLLLWLFPKARYTTGPYLFWLLFWYAAAKALEAFDREVFALFGNLVSGHTLKHLAAAGAVAVVIRMIQRNCGEAATKKADGAVLPRDEIPA